MPTFRFVGERDAEGFPQEFAEGVPARDLSEDDFALLDDEHKELVQASPLYQEELSDGQPSSSPRRVRTVAIPPVDPTTPAETPAPTPDGGTN